MAFLTSTSLRVVNFNRPRRESQVCSRRVRQGTWSASAGTAQQVKEVERYLSMIAKAERPAYLDALIHVLTNKDGVEATSPTARQNLHPFFIPLCYHADNKQTTGLLRWPTPPEDLPMPVVTCSADDPCLTLLSPSPRAHVTRALVEADCSGDETERDHIRSSSSLALAYQNGDAEKSGLGFEQFLTMLTGGFPDIYEGLVRFHLAKGDQSAALVTCERASRGQIGWGRAHAFHAEILQELEREAESKDAARFCLQMPLWTLGSVNKVRDMGVLAGYQDTKSLSKIYRRLFEDGRAEEIADGKAPQQVALDRAAWLLDVCVAERTIGDSEGWEEVRERLAELYDEAGLADVATFVRY